MGYRAPTKPVRERFEASYRIDQASGCWVWQKTCKGGGYKNGINGGYGQLRIGSRDKGGRKLVYAHRLSYELYVGPIPAGTELDHLCRNRSCCNPTHLEPVTRAENMRRGNVVAISAQVRAARRHA